MKLEQFKAWFEGFTENIGETGPTKAQWQRIQERVKEIDGTDIVYIPQYYYNSYPFWGSDILRGYATGLSGETYPYTVSNNLGDYSSLADLGRAEAKQFLSE